MERSKLIYADFMKMDDEGRLILVCRGTFNDLAKHNISLANGGKFTFYSDDADNEGNQDDLVVEGEVEYDEKNKRWTAKINLDEIKNISQLTLEEKKKLSLS
jgi:hypothetical protein